MSENVNAPKDNPVEAHPEGLNAPIHEEGKEDLAPLNTEEQKNPNNYEEEAKMINMPGVFEIGADGINEVAEETEEPVVDHRSFGQVEVGMTEEEIKDNAPDVGVQLKHAFAFILDNLNNLQNSEGAPTKTVELCTKAMAEVKNSIGWTLNAVNHKEEAE